MKSSSNEETFIPRYEPLITYASRPYVELTIGHQVWGQRARVISGGMLSISGEPFTRTHPLYQPDLLSELFFSLMLLSPVPPGIRSLMRNDKLFSRSVSCLDAVSTYQLRRGCPASPFRMTGKLVAAASCSSRTNNTLLSVYQHTRHRKSNLSHDGLNPAHVPF